jgi:outer membrane protein assembly factor BamB
VAGVRAGKPGAAARWAAAGLDAAGTELWRTDVPAAATCGPVSGHSAGETRAWLVGLENGDVVELDAAKGGSARTWKTAGNLPVTALAGPLAAENAKRAAVRAVAANAAGVTAFGNGDAPLWSLPLPGVRRMAASPGGETVVAGTDNGELVCINADGTVRWRDTRASGTIRGITTLPISGGRCAVLYTAADHYVTALDGGPMRAAE